MKPGRKFSIYSILIVFMLIITLDLKGYSVFAVHKKIFAENEADLSSTVVMFRGDAKHSGAFKTKELESFGGIQWQVKTGGAVRSSPILSKGILFIGSSDGFLYALDSATGTERWKFNAKDPIVSTPAVASDTVYFGTRDGRFIALDTTTGKNVWTVKTGIDTALAWGYESGDFFTSSPTIAENQVFFGGGDGFLYALELKSGKELWKFQTGGRIRSTPAVNDDGTVFVGSFDGKLYAVERDTGKLKWSYETEGAKLNSGDFGYDRRSIQSSPAIWKNTVLFGARDGFLYAVESGSGKLLWRYDHKISWVNSSPAVVDGMVYGASSDGRFVNCVDIESGKELWRFKTDSLVWSSPAVTQNFFYVGDWAGNLYALDRTKGTEVWRFKTGKRILTSPILDDGKLFFGDDGGRIFALNSQEKTSLKRAVFWDPDYAKGAVFVSHEKIRDYFKGNGYEVLDSAKLTAFLNERKTDHIPSVVVFAIDYLPKPLDVDEKGLSLLKDYLRTDGKVVWLGIPPQMWEKDLQKGEFTSMKINRPITVSLLGVSHQRGNFDNNSAHVTNAGRKWGLEGWMLCNWAADPETVTTILAEDEQGLAAAWVKNYGGSEGTGFVRVPVIETEDGSPTNLAEIKMAAEYMPK